MILVTLWTAQAGEETPGYAGSKACQGCHTYLYRNWKSTRHGSSLMTATQAREAGYPLPKSRLGGSPLTIQSWDEITYVIGRRKRLAYIDAEGLVLDTGYHQRQGRWGPFPTARLSECGNCHFTGPGAADAPAPLTGNWKELDIGCEACHGPGAQHVATLDREDILVDASPRICGSCHTTVGKVLPQDDRQDMHDLIQVWNHDAHTTGTRFNSFTAFCAECHAPFQGQLNALPDSASQAVFTEQKKAIGCISCHNPHELTSEHYQDASLSLQPAVPPRLHTYGGNDRDFTTTDFQEHADAQELCMQCHRGADRVDMDHANASCTDCHNSYNRNRQPESRVFHNANQPQLSCQPCHRDADHLMAILYEDDEFLAPRHIHNLRTLPQAARVKYGFRLPREDGYKTAIGDSAVSYQEPQTLSREVGTAETGEARTTVSARVRLQAQGIRTLLASELHVRLAKNPDISALQEDLLSAPGRITAYLALAYAYVQAGETAGDIIELALQLDTPEILLESGFVETIRPEPPAALSDLDPLAQASQLLPEHSGLLAYLQLRHGSFDEVVTTLGHPGAPGITGIDADLLLGLAELGRQRYPAALNHLERVLQHSPGHVTARLGAGWGQLQQGRFHQGRNEILQVLEREPDNNIANYLLGRAYLLRGDAKKAVSTLRASLEADSGPMEVWYQYARSLRLTGSLQAAIYIYGEILARHPTHFDSRFELAGLLKLTADTAAFRYQAEREARRPPQTSTADWESHLTTLASGSRAYTSLALSEYALAQRLRPDNRRIVQQVGNIYRRSGRLDRAYAQFAWLTAREPGQWQHQYRLGSVLLEQKQYADAVAALTAAVNLAPAEGDNYFALGLALVGADRLPEALETFRRGTVYEPFNPALYTNLGAVAGRLGHYEDAVIALERSLSLASFPLPRVHLTHTNLALAYLAQGRAEEAGTALKRALHAWPDYATARALLAKIQSGDPPDSTPAALADDFVFNDFLARFGEVTTVAFSDE